MKKIITIVTMYIFYMAQVFPVFAEDIEIYQGGDTGIRPNVMFLLDTSGSMNEKITIAGDFYDPEETYPGPFRNDRLYFFEFIETGSDIGDWKVFRDAILDNTIHPDAFKCQTLKSTLENKGYAVSKFLQWDPSIDFEVYYAFKGWKPFHGVWRNLRQTDDPNRYVDCQPDISNAHGLTAGDGKPYMSHDGNGEPYTSDYSKRVPNLLPAHIFRPAIPAFAGRGWWGYLPLAIGATETIYTGNYLNYDFATQNGITRVPRLYFMGQIISDMVAQYPGVNAGLARFDGRLLGDLSFNFDGNIFTNPITYDPPQGGMIGIESVPSEGNALRFENTIKGWDAWGMTPLTESYYEAARYMRGDSVKYGDRTKVFATRDSFLGLGGTYHNFPSVAASRVGGVSNADYQSPVTESCQPNHMIIFSDGKPTDDTDANSDIKSLIAGLSLPAGLDLNCSGDGQCADELAYYLSSQDQFDEAGDFIGTQTIKTHAISGFVSDAEKVETDALLKSLSETHGDGIFASANTEEGVREAFKRIFDSIVGSSVSFTSPVVSVNAFNSLELSDELYYSVFEPKGNLSWEGNIKQYRMGEIAGEFAVVDADDESAVDELTGYFRSSARSIWTEPDSKGNGDGFHVTKGGIASRLPSARHAFTSPSSSTDGNADPLAELSTATASKERLGIQTKDSNYHNNLITWAKGQGRKEMEDPLHSEPAIITYSKTVSEQTQADGTVTYTYDTDRTLFIGTNSGFLHAFDIDQSEPSEHFTFIPKELLQNLDKYETGGGVNANKAYGIDGPITKWHQDINGDGQVNNGEKAYVYITLRRGGQSIYALEVSDRSTPKLLWEKHGNYPNDFPNKPAVSSGYENLGQTWGRLEPATIEFEGEDRVVLFMPGGYDPAEDGTISDGNSQTGPLARIEHSQGTTIYMIDALTGDVLWDAKAHSPSEISSQMTSSFPADVAPIDVKGNGRVDLLYATDVGGRIWRFDFNIKENDDTEDTPFKDKVEGAIIADLNSGEGAGNRRIYNEPDIIGDFNTKTIYISVGTGNRSHPKTRSAGAAQNYHYVIKDTVMRPLTRGILSHYDLVDLTEPSINRSEELGWYMPLTKPGEKVLSRSTTVGKQILFTTFAPKEAIPGSCDVRPGFASLYKIDLNKWVTASVDLASGGIPPTPMLIPPKRKAKVDLPGCTTPGSCSNNKQSYSILVGAEVVDPPGSGLPSDDDIFSESYWLELPQ